MGEKGKYLEIPKRIEGLNELAYNFWWSWHPEGRLLFKMLSRTAWKLSQHNPVKMISEMGPERLQKAANDPIFLKNYDSVMEKFKDYMNNKKTFLSKEFTPNDQSLIAFFSAEYGLHHSLPFYAGGLGFFAGDLLKECSDLGIPTVGIGFMYPEGYIKQRISPDGWQIEENETIDRKNAPIHRIMDSNGDKLIVKIPIIEPPIFVEVCKLQIGKVPLYLMDTDIEMNDPWNRSITSHLYIGNPEQRLRQEMVLGLGGIQVLRKLKIPYKALHLNEGHTVFAILERIRENIENGMTSEKAFNYVKNSTIFTSHTPVEAGHDVFSFSLMDKYFSSYWPSIGLNRDEFFKLGMKPDESKSGFNMTALGLNASSFHNGVSKRHGQIARRMWKSLWPDLSEEKVPIDYVTNGVHIPTWIEYRMKTLFDTYLTSDWLNEQDNALLWKQIEKIPDEELWKTHQWLKTKLILRILDRARIQWMNEIHDARMLPGSGLFLDPMVLTIGFARRFATYKRADLILKDVDRLQKILQNRWKPVQIIFAGKAHPADNGGKQILQRVFNAARDPMFGGRIAFIEDYDEQIAQYMVHGVDVWLNNPLPPLEACGTSGMKASINGVPNLSILDGWWIEGYNGKNGWGFGKDDLGQRDVTDSNELYDILEKKIIPIYYDQNDQGISTEWIKIMKQSIVSTAPVFNTQRMMKEYVFKFYKNISSLKS